jgi:hypothetical protein
MHAFVTSNMKVCEFGLFSVQAHLKKKRFDLEAVLNLIKSLQFYGTTKLPILNNYKLEKILFSIIIISV